MLSPTTGSTPIQYDRNPKCYYFVQGEPRPSPKIKAKNLLGSHRSSPSDQKGISKIDIQRQFICGSAMKLSIDIQSIANEAHVCFQSAPSTDPQLYSIYCPSNDRENRWAVMRPSPYKDKCITTKKITTQSKSGERTMELIINKIIFTTAEYFSRPKQINHFLMAYLLCGENAKGIFDPKHPNQCQSAVRTWNRCPRKFNARINCFFKNSTIVRNLILGVLKSTLFSKIKGKQFEPVKGQEMLPLDQPEFWSNSGRVILNFPDHMEQDVEPSYYFGEGKKNEQDYSIEHNSSSQREVDALRKEFGSDLFQTVLDKQRPIQTLIYEIALQSINEIRGMIHSAAVPSTESTGVADRRFITLPPLNPGEENTLLPLKTVRGWFASRSKVVRLDNSEQNQFYKKIANSALYTVCHHLADNLDFKSVLTIMTADPCCWVARTPPAKRATTYEMLIKNPQNFSVRVIEDLKSSKMLFALINSFIMEKYAEQIREGTVTPHLCKRKSFSFEDLKLQFGLGYLKLKGLQ